MSELDPFFERIWRAVYLANATLEPENAAFQPLVDEKLREVFDVWADSGEIDPCGETVEDCVRDLAVEAGAGEEAVRDICSAVAHTIRTAVQRDTGQDPSSVDGERKLRDIWP